MAAPSPLVADIEKFILKSEERTLAVVRGSLRDMVDDMQVPVAKGGRMRVDTGFLRASGRSSLEGLPSGNGVRPADAPVGKYTGIYDTFDGTAVNATLLEMKLGDTFYWGWVARYAQYRETYDGFMHVAIQNFQTYVNKNSEKFRGK